MIITGIENNYYLVDNDIWITAKSESEMRNLVMKITNSIGDEMVLEMQPINNECKFNISLPIRAMFQEVRHLSAPLNTFQAFTIEFSSASENTATSFTKMFVKGKRTKYGNANKNWHLVHGENLFKGKWLKFENAPNVVKPLRIIGNHPTEVELTEGEIYRLSVREKCDVKVVKFLNHLGGYNQYVFEKYEEKTSTKAQKSISKIAEALNAHNFRQQDPITETTLEVHTKTPHELQHLITDLIASPDVYLYVEDGVMNEDRWLRLRVKDNDSLVNNWDRTFENKITFEIL